MCSLSEHFIVLERFFFALTLVLFYFVFAPLLTLIAASPVANLKVRIMFGRFVGGKACPKHVCLGFVCLVDWSNDSLIPEISDGQSTACAVPPRTAQRSFQLSCTFSYLGLRQVVVLQLKKKQNKTKGFFFPHYAWPVECLDSWRTHWSDNLSNTVCHGDTETCTNGKVRGCFHIISIICCKQTATCWSCLHTSGSKKRSFVSSEERFGLRLRFILKKLIKVRFLFLSVWVVRSGAVIPPDVPFVGQSRQLWWHI